MPDGSGRSNGASPGVTALDAARLFGVHERTIRRAIGRGELEASKRGRSFQITPEALDRYRLRRADRARPRSARCSLPRSEPEVVPVASTLPPLAPPTSFVGRERDVATATALLGSGVRLLTLTGPGGVGKTRLAMAVAAAMRDRFPGGVHVVELAAVRNPTALLDAIAEEVEAIETRDQPLPAAVAARLASGPHLLVLDNFEHLRPAGPTVTALLAACPNLAVLVTSRLRLRLSPEHELPVPPLALPPTDDLPPEQLIAYGAIRLFVDRARAADGRFTLSCANGSAVAAVCRRLDGLPLALELAAARLRVLSPAALAVRLTDQLGLLSGGPADAPPRLRSMREAIAWSYDLLAEPEQALFRRLAVFAGGFTFEAAEGIVAVEAGPRQPGDTPSTLDRLTALLDAGLVRRVEADGAEPRFGLLEPVRQFGLEPLAASGDETAARDAHAAVFLALAERAEPFLLGPEQPLWFGRLEADLANLHAALDWLHERGDALRALRLAGALGLLWTWPPYLREGRARLEAVLAMPGIDAYPEPLAKARHAAGNVAHWQSDDAAAEAFFAAALAGWRDLGHDQDIAHALRSLASLALERGELDRAEGLLVECRPIFERLADTQGLGFVLMTLGLIASARDNHDAALHLHEASLAAWASVPGEGYTPGALANIGWEHLLRREPMAARDPYARVLEYARTEGDQRAYADAISGAAGIATARGDAVLAVHLFAAAAAIRDEIGVALRVTTQTQHDRLLTALRRRLGEVAFWTAWAQGGRMPTAAAAATAATLLQPPTPNPDGDALSGLTSRERDVLRLLAQGSSDKEIPAALSVSRRTASKHVSAILGKLGVPSRAAAAALAVRVGLVAA